MILRAERERKRERERRVRGVFILHGWKLVSGSKRDREGKVGLSQIKPGWTLWYTHLSGIPFTHTT